MQLKLGDVHLLLRHRGGRLLLLVLLEQGGIVSAAAIGCWLGHLHHPLHLLPVVRLLQIELAAHLLQR